MLQVVDLRQVASVAEVAGEVCASLQRGELIGLPSETRYLVAASATDAKACARLSEIAARHGAEHCVLLLPHPESLLDFVPEVPRDVDRLLRRCWPGPVVIRIASIVDGAFSELAPAAQELLKQSGVSVCVPAHPFLKRVAELSETPIVALISSLPAGKSWADSDGLEVARSHAQDLALVVDAGPPRHPQGPTVIEVTREGWTLAKEGVVPQSMLNRLSSSMILFVCTGNTCRSPMAEGLFRKLLAERLNCAMDELAQHGYLVLSAGVSASPGMPAATDALALLRSEGVDLSDHASQPATEDLLTQADHVLAMTAGHLDVLHSDFPQLREKMRMLSPGHDIADPIGGGWSVYQDCGAEIRLALEAFLDELFGKEKAPSR
jgi:L-threonylcarbamoyladenylate synthase